VEGDGRLYLDSVESLVRNLIQKQKIDMANEVGCCPAAAAAAGGLGLGLATAGQESERLPLSIWACGLSWRGS
jgi:hypothetical protein